MTEEQVTKALLKWLTERGWQIVSFDFPQSGTGRVLHPDHAEREKSKGSFIPDIVAVKNHISLFFENKDRFYFPDYFKVHELIVNNRYSNAIDNLLADYEIARIYYGIGSPTECRKGMESADLVHFLLGVNADRSITILSNPEEIPF